MDTTKIKKIPQRKEVKLLLKETISYLFPVLAEDDTTKESPSEIRGQFEIVLRSFNGYDDDEIAKLSSEFILGLELLREVLTKDATAIYNGDPAAESIEEIIACYPGFYATAVYRIANKVSQLGIPTLPRMLTEIAHSKTGIDIHPKATIGENFCIDHGTGVVIGETTIIGNNVKIYQGVTLGALSVTKHQAGVKRHPTIGDNTIIYAGSTILGGDTVIGHDSTIGGNVWLTSSVAPYSFIINNNPKYKAMKKNTILELVGNTPTVRINNLYDNRMEAWIKLEKSNPGGSIKDRIAYAMIEKAEKEGKLKKGSVIIEATSGNTGIGLAMIAAVKGYRLIIVMPESMSIERRKVIKAYGAEIVLTPREKGMKGAILRAEELQRELDGWMPLQFENPANPEIHESTTALEILNDFPEGLDYIVTGVGTGGHISGVASVLKKRWKNLKVIAVEPADSPVISGGNPSPHAIQGIGAGFIPANLNTSILDGVVTINKEEAFLYASKAASQEGMFVGISTGASLAAINKIKEELEGKRVLTFAYDTGERYLSVADFCPEI